MAAKLIEFLQAGVEGAVNGSVEFYAPNTLTPAVVYSDYEAEDAVVGTISLGTLGQITLFTIRQVRCIVRDAAGIVLFDKTASNDAAALVTHGSESFTGNDLAEVLDLAKVSFGGTDWKLQLVSGETEMPLKDWARGVHVDAGLMQGVRDDDATDCLLGIQRAIDYCEAQGGGVVFLPRRILGIYRVSGILRLRPGVSLRGVSATVTTIRSTGTGLGLIVDGGGCVAENFTLTGPAAGGARAGFAIRVDAADSVLSGLVIGGTWGLTPAWDSGIEILPTTDSVAVKGCLIRCEVGVGIHLAAGTGVVGTGNTGYWIEKNTIYSAGVAVRFSWNRAGVAFAPDVWVRDNALFGSDDVIAVDSAYTGGIATIQANHFINGVGTISFLPTLSRGFRQLDNGHDVHAEAVATAGTFTPRWLANGLYQRVSCTTGGAGNLNIAAPVPTPSSEASAPYVNEALSLQIHVHHGAAAITDVWNAAYEVATLLVGANEDHIYTFWWDSTTSLWREVGVTL